MASRTRGKPRVTRSQPPPPPDFSCRRIAAQQLPPGKREAIKPILPRRLSTSEARGLRRRPTELKKFQILLWVLARKDESQARKSPLAIPRARNQQHPRSG